ncbi:uncharacterized protein LOC122062709 [Macadamia integrifolia]|uniref:uncharacterized protein LOC122062709 n=1 Tax=Macadamia integrifolia TaxID=60698 RepID=UPI001C4F832F|nr:uncharacterized protein LOC122062709 [Macadamia integrifolia]
MLMCRLHLSSLREARITFFGLSQSSMEPDVAANVMFHSTAKGVWNDLKETYSQEKNMTRIYDIYEKLFQYRQSDKPLAGYYSAFRDIVEEFNVFQPLITDIDKLKAQCNEFFVSKFLAGMNNDLKAVKGHLLAGDTVPTLNDTYSRLQRITSSTKPDQSSKDNSAFHANRGRGRGHGGGRGSVGRGSGGQPSERTACQCTFCGKPNHTVETCWEKHGKLEWTTQLANHAVYDDGTNTMAPVATKPTPSLGDSATSLLLHLLVHPHPLLP